MAQMIDKYDAIAKKYSLKKVAKIHKKTKLDGCFQRHGGVEGGSGWPISNSNKYLTNLLAGSTYNCVILASVVDCYDDAVRRNCQENIDYYKGAILDGYEYVSIDGNNTTSSVAAFVDGHEDIYVTHKGKEMKLSDFSEDDRDDILDDEKVNYVILRKIDVEDMCNLFRDLNTSTKLNGQEWRQARWSDTSEVIRDISNGDNRVLFKNFVFSKESDLDKRCHEEMVAQLVLKIKADYLSGDQIARNLDDLYEKTLSLPTNTKDKLIKILEISRAMAGTCGALKKKLAKGALHSLWDVIQIATHEHSLKIDKPAEFFEWFLKKNAEFTTAAAKVVEEKRDEESYIYWIRYYNRHSSWKRIRALFRSTLVGDMEGLVNDGVLKYKRTSKDTFTWKQKLELFRKQNGKTRKGEAMTYLDLYLGKLEADHMVSVKEGGKTEERNGELMFGPDNRGKAANSNDPHFPHQMPEQQQLETAINE